MAGIRKTRTVYIISSILCNKVYIGSTYQQLNQRLHRHKNKSNTCSSYEVIQHGDYMISPLLIVPNCTRQEIELKERDFIFCFKDICVNFRGTKDSYSKDYKRPYDLDGRRKYWCNTKNICCVCGGKYTNEHKAHHFKTKIGPNMENTLFTSWLLETSVQIDANLWSIVGPQTM